MRSLRQNGACVGTGHGWRCRVVRLLIRLQRLAHREFRQWHFIQPRCMEHKHALYGNGSICFVERKHFQVWVCDHGVRGAWGDVGGFHYFTHCEWTNCSFLSPGYREAIDGREWLVNVRCDRDHIRACTMGCHGQGGSHNRLRLSSPQYRKLVHGHESLRVSPSSLHERGTHADSGICGDTDACTEGCSDFWFVDRAPDRWAGAAWLVFDRNDLDSEDNRSNTGNGVADMACRFIQNTLSESLLRAGIAA